MTDAILSETARIDVIEAIQWISKENPSTAEALRIAIVSATRQLVEYPLSGTERPDVASSPTRFLTLTGFPYVLVYEAINDPPVILRVLHGSRDLPEILKLL
ncbi:MAG: type II toxin-antitoxin system RelE/ParE family toxin [Magnetovibrionaceae bacterium]